MPQIVDGNKIADQIFSSLKSRIASLKFQPRLGVFLIGENPASLSYIKIKQKRAEEIGIAVDLKKYSESVSQEELINSIKAYSAEENVSGMIIQLPLPKHIDRDTVLNCVPENLDVDCLSSINKEKLIKGHEFRFVPPAAGAVLEILKFYNVDLANKNIVLVGSGDLVGKPLAAILLHEKINFEIANRHTENFSELLGKAEVIISGVGKPGLITADTVKDGAVVIDAGTAGSEEGIAGDVDFESVKDKTSLISAVPGGVGPVTVAMLLRNVIAAAEKVPET